MADFRDFVKPSGAQLQMLAFAVNAVGMCSCGNPQPLVVTFSPQNSAGFAVCPMCETSFRIDRFVFDRGSEKSSLSVTFGVKTPPIVKPTVRDIIDVGKPS